VNPRITAVFLIWCLPLWTAGARAHEPIPAGKCLKASVTRELRLPGENALRLPTDVAVGCDDRVYVADGVNDRIVCLDPDGNLVLTLSEVAGGKLQSPVGLTVDRKDQLWIADTGNHRLLVLTAQGALVESIDLPPADNGRAANPTDVTVTQDGKRCYVVDNVNHRLLVRDQENGPWTALGKQGEALGQFDRPFMIALGAENYVYVTEAIGARVQRLSPKDLWSGVIGRWGIELGQFYRPKGIAIDSEGQVYVSDSTLGVIQVFGPWGDIRGVLTDNAGAPLRFGHPMGLAFDSAQRLYVVELLRDCISVVTLEGKKPEEALPGSNAGGVEK
jgi:DNA-binding beta-propeller fold protein YncE